MDAPFKIWLAAARPRTLPAAVAPVLVGTACAHAVGAVAWGPALAALAGALLLQLAANFSNDVFDAESGADGPDRIGPTRAVAAGLITPRAMKAATALCVVAALAVGGYLVALRGWPVVAIGLSSIAAALAYTGGPWPLGYHGLGDVFVLAFFGFVAVAGTAFVQLGETPRLALAAGLGVGALATAILVVNNVRDIASDTRAGKRTLAVRWGRRGALIEYVALLGAAYATALALAIAYRSPAPCLPLLSAPLAAARARQLAAAADGPAHNRLLAQTAQLMLMYSALLAIGIALLGR
ncbi:MAG: 1,4-dihydroxy-2-naphthoate polyprenyltransferase [Kofleriaceae bacterium]